MKGKEYYSIEAADEETLKEAIATQTGMAFPCGGTGTCGKCLVRIVDGVVSPPSEQEKKILGAENLGNGVRLACCLTAEGKVAIEEFQQGASRILSDYLPRKYKHSPSLRYLEVTLPPPDTDDPEPDIERLCASLENDLSLIEMARVPQILRANDFRCAIFTDGERLLGVSAPHVPEELGVAIDLGTTTIVCHLIDYSSGTIIDSVSEQNPQKNAGADVISRIQFAEETSNGLEKMKKLAGDCINRLIGILRRKHSLATEAIHSAAVCGNTTMIHLLLGLPPAEIGRAPFTPVTLEPMLLRCGEAGIDVCEWGRVFIPPGIAGYVGSDIVCGVIASGMTEQNESSLFVDIGTNGEIVAANGRELTACSTAAGPAFEGAKLIKGMSGVDGAISSVAMEGGRLAVEVIGGGEAKGICGSGVIDAIALFLREGVIDETGRILPQEEVSAVMHPYYGEADGEKILFLDLPARNVYLSQGDIREIQLASAAIAAGIAVCLKENLGGILDCLYIAGGFGSYISIENAIEIGLLPPIPLSRCVNLGNAAGYGAALALLSQQMRKEMEALPKSVKYLELSTHPSFQMEYIEHMAFGKRIQ